MTDCDAIPTISINKIREDHYADDGNDVWLYSEDNAPGGKVEKWSVSVRPIWAPEVATLILKDTNNMVARNQSLTDAFRIARLLVTILKSGALIAIGDCESGLSP